jgi:hypothetical protein
MHRDLVKLIGKGPKLYCSFSKSYYHSEEMNPDGNGGWINKKFDTRVHNEEVNQSKHKKGPGWQMGWK